jgi:hypothetical protein
MAGKEKENMKIRKGKQRRVLATASSALSGRRRRRLRREVEAHGLLMHVIVYFTMCTMERGNDSIVYDARWREGTSVYDGERKRVCTRCAYEVYDVYDVYDGDWSR